MNCSSRYCGMNHAVASTAHPGCSARPPLNSGCPVSAASTRRSKRLLTSGYHVALPGQKPKPGPIGWPRRRRRWIGKMAPSCGPNSRSSAHRRISWTRLGHWAQLNLWGSSANCSSRRALRSFFRGRLPDRRARPAEHRRGHRSLGHRRAYSSEPWPRRRRRLSRTSGIFQPGPSMDS